MDAFLLVTPEEWTEVPGATNIVNINGGASGFQSIAASGSFAEMDEWAGLKETAYLPDGYTVVDARLFDTSEAMNALRLWIKIALV